MLHSLIAPLKDRAALTQEQVRAAVVALVDESTPADLKADFLVALSQKGETASEIAAFASHLRDLAIRPELDRETASREILDVCGTGGDKLNTFNISTTVAIVAASAEVTVAKHGNRAITSQAGSADVLDELGIPTTFTPKEAAKSLSEVHFAFFFAPSYHPAFKHIGPCRKICAERGHRTIFNFLGPLLNPVRPRAQLLGVPRPELCLPLAEVLRELGSRRVMVVSGATPNGHLDELSILGGSSIAEFYHDKGFHNSILDARDFGIQPCSLEELRGGDRRENARILRRILAGEERGAKLSAVLLNSAAALFIAGKVKSLTEGLEFSDELIRSGKALKKLDQLIRFRP
ncbi:MAG: anthranilate phosphoribosyltransferase [Verrucomicrobiota bacterium]